MADYRASAETNWPLIAGVGILAAVLFYALYIVNGQLGAADSLVGGAGTDIQAIFSPFTSAATWLSNLFNGSSDTGGTDQ